MSYFDNMIELNALLANLNLIKKDYNGAINANQETLKVYETITEKEIKSLGITKAEIIHNLGYVYFERGLEKNSDREKLIALSWNSKNDKKIENNILNIKNEIIVDFNKATEIIENASNMESSNLHIIDQLSRLYYRKAEISEGNLRDDLFEKSISFYEKLISDNNDDEIEKKQEASIFIAIALAKLGKLSEAKRLINTVINYKPLFYLGYYAKSCIYSIIA